MCIVPFAFRVSYETSKLILMAASTWLKVVASTNPRRLMSRCRSTTRIWLSRVTEGTDSPVVASAGSSACTGFRGNRTVDVIGATMVVLVNRLDVLFWMTNAGLVFLISEPTVGSSAVR